MKMITLENILVAEKGIDAVWSFFNDVNSVAVCVPTMVKYEVIDENTVYCDLRIRLGLIPLDSKARITITERQGNRHLEARGETEAGEIMKKFGKLATETVTKLHIILDLEEIGPNKTRIHYRINADAVGQMKRIYEAVIKGQRAKMETQFIENVGKGLGTKVVIEEAEAA
jgi:carbon monoxide dehydrogenase subunit G